MLMAAMLESMAAVFGLMSAVLELAETFYAGSGTYGYFQVAGWRCDPGPLECLLNQLKVAEY